jgi:chromate transport protein ChrA
MEASSLHSSQNVETRNTVETILLIFISLLVIYAIFISFDLIALVISLGTTLLLYIGFKHALDMFHSREGILWSAFGVVVIVVSSFEQTKCDNGFYLLLVVLVFASIVYLVIKTTKFLVILIFTFLYLASNLLVKHISKL